MRSVRLMAGRRPISAALVAPAAAWAAPQAGTAGTSSSIGAPAALHFAIFDLENAAAENTVHARATLSA